LQQKGKNKEDVLAELKKRRTLDKSYANGRIMNSMCTKPHPIAKKAYTMFFDSNLGDSGLFPSAAQLEREVIAQLSELMHCKTACGFIVSGGTEANLLAIAATKKNACSNSPELVLPQSAHFSFTKICRLLNIKPVYAPLDSSYSVDAKIVEKLVNTNTIAIVGTVGTAEFGAVDPVEALSETALRKNIPLHVDAAFGGLVLPFLKDIKSRFDFSLEGVKSITVDPHKMGLAAIPAGGILFRDPESLESLKTETPYLTDNHQYTFVGTRSGASAASAWAVFQALGAEGYKKIVTACMKNTSLLAKGLVDAGFSLAVEPTLNVVAFRTKDSKTLYEQLWRQGWYVSYNKRYDCIRIVVMPHIKRKHIAAFLRDLGREKV
jgi:tyrosine decarboxylase/aspartate 1-decarboxylase